MAVQVPGHTIGHEVASVDLTAAQFRGIVFTPTGVALAAVGGKCDGILQNNPKIGEACSVMTTGQSKAVAAAAMNKGDDMAVGADGKFKAAAAGEFIIGTCMETVAAVDEVSSVNQTRPGVKA